MNWTTGTDPARIVYRRQLVHSLLSLMRRVLIPQDYKLILMRCGMDEAPGLMEFDELALFFGLESPGCAGRRYDCAIASVRAAIPGSEVERWMGSYHRLYSGNSLY